jgi:STAM-binding protein
MTESEGLSTDIDSRHVRFDSHPPPLPPKPVPRDVTGAPTPPTKVSEAADRSQNKSPSYTFASEARLEDGSPLRTIFLPPTLRTTFLRLAYKNTQSNLETCGFLAGTLISNALFVSKLIVPSQISTSDTCEMTNESQLFDLVDAEADLMILGWIHTHPTQTCFMSSRDLHTHAGYQMMLAESIAIVCAPSKGDTTHGGDWGIYRLTDPPGKKTILGCQKPGIFHPHDVDNIYTDALRPGHVVEAKGLEFDVVDLRDG